MAPAWSGETVLGPVPVRLDLSSTARQVLNLFRCGASSRNQVKEEGIRFLGQELGAAALPDPLGESLAGVLDLAAHGHQLVTLEVRTADPSALALPWELISLPGRPLPVQEGLVEIVRRIPGPGDPVDPIADTAATLPAEYLSVLGFTAAPVEDEAGASLFWETEQERLLLAFEDLLRERRGQLSLPDTGAKEDLLERLGGSDRPQVEVLKLYQEILQIVELLGDVRSRAATLGDIARLRAQSGDVAGALKLHEENLQISRQLGDIEGIAQAQYELAGLDLKQKNRAHALERLADSWQISWQIKQVDFIAAVGQLYGLVLAETDPSRALEILRTSRDAFQLLGMTAEVNEVEELIRRIEQSEPPAEPPRPSFWQRLKRRLGGDRNSAPGGGAGT